MKQTFKKPNRETVLPHCRDKLLRECAYIERMVLYLEDAVDLLSCRVAKRRIPDTAVIEEVSGLTREVHELRNDLAKLADDAKQSDDPR